MMTPTPRRTGPPPETFPYEILVPFPIESHLSGVAAPLAPEEEASYRRTFEAPELAFLGAVASPDGAAAPRDGKDSSPDGKKASPKQTKWTFWPSKRD